MIVKFQFRLATAAEWESSNVVLDAGEPGYDTTNKALKIGDGTSTWSALNFQAADPAVFSAAVADSTAAQQAAEAAQAAAEVAADSAQQAAEAATVVPRFTTVERPDPTAQPGQMIYDTDLGKTLISNGTTWEDMMGTDV